jgi:site-specific recombinase XerD
MAHIANQNRAYNLKNNRLTSLVLNGVTSENSKRAYATGLRQFFAWLRGQSPRPFTKALVEEYRSSLLALELSPATINLRLSPLRKLAREMADNGLMDGNLARGIDNARNVKQQGVRVGNWLTSDKASELLNAPDPDTLGGKRDRAILALLIGCGLRRAEVLNLEVDQIQQREGRWVIPDLVGKGMRRRTVPVPSWVKVRIRSGCWRRRLTYREGGSFVPSPRAASWRPRRSRTRKPSGIWWSSTPRPLSFSANG